jgi:hypothetical protein
MSRGLGGEKSAQCVAALDNSTSPCRQLWSAWLVAAAAAAAS